MDEYKFIYLFYLGYEDVLGLLIKYGKNVDVTAKNNETPLMWAVESGKY